MKIDKYSRLPLKEYRDKTTDCGKRWENLPTGCFICNGGPHYHYENGSCDNEPCYRHGGPA